MSKQEESHFSLSEMFEQAFTNHNEDEMERYWAVGAPGNIPSIDNIPSDNPRPWMFIRILGLGIAIFLILLYAWCKFYATNLLPGLIFVGNSAIPISVVILFFELNVRCNISMYMVTKMLFFGGALSLLIGLVNEVIAKMFGFNMDWMGAMRAGPLEETAKLLAVIVILGNLRRYPYILNGLLFGAAVGAGFALFESSGYVLRALIKHIITICIDNGAELKNTLLQIANTDGAEALNDSLERLFALTANASNKDMLITLAVRGILAPAGHVIWTSLNAAALWRVKGSDNFKLAHFCDIRFFSIFICTVCMHMLWNSNWRPNAISPFDKYIILGVIGWALVFWMIRKGLQQIREARDNHAGRAIAKQDAGEQEISSVIQTQAEYARKLYSFKLTNEDSRFEYVEEKGKSQAHTSYGSEIASASSGNTSAEIKRDPYSPGGKPTPSSDSKASWRDYYDSANRK